MAHKNTSSESEKSLEKRLGQKVKSVGGWSIKLEANFHAGLPDRLCIFPGAKVFFVEVKTTGKKPRKIQLYVHRLLRKLGFDVRVIDRSDQIEKLIEDATRD